MCPENRDFQDLTSSCGFGRHLGALANGARTTFTDMTDIITVFPRKIKF